MRTHARYCQQQPLACTAPAGHHRNGAIGAWQALFEGAPPQSVFPADVLPPVDPAAPLKAPAGEQRRRLRFSVGRRLWGAWLAQHPTPHPAQGPDALTALAPLWALMLHRCSAQDDVVLGVLDLRGNGHPAPLLQRVVPVRSSLQAHSTWPGLLSAWAAQQLVAQRAGAALPPAAQPAPALQTVLVLSDRKTPAHVHAQGTGLVGAMDLVLHVRDDGDRVGFEFDADARQHSSPGLLRWRASLVTLLHAALTMPETGVCAWPLVSRRDRRLLARWNNTAVDIPAAPGGAGLHHWIEQQVARTPDAVAVVLDAQVLSYAELDQRARVLACRLQALGVTRHGMVGVFLERSFNMVVAMLAIWKAGGVYLPLEPDFPTQRLHDTIADSAALLVITVRNLRSSLPAGTPVLCLDALDEADPEARAVFSPAEPTQADDACYVIYTSGSTGKPKGAVLPHRAICNHMAWMVAHYGMGADDHVLQKTPFSFDASVWEFLAPLVTGARLVLARPGGHRDMPYLARTIAQNRVTTLQLVPSVLQLLVDEPSFAACSSLRRVYCGGEALTTALVQRFKARLPAVDLHNLYGPTECCIDTTSWVCSGYTPAVVQPIGRPVWNTTHHVLDQQQQPVPPGVPGELYIGGAGLALGYLNREQLTAERFVTLTLAATEPPRRLYRTGDRVRLSPEGSYEFLGRIDFQVKLNGFRIELGEIEAVLEMHPRVKQAVAVLREDLPGHKLLVAYVLPRDAAQPTAAELREHMARSLPSHMLPGLCMVLASLPLTSNGKLDRRALPAPQRAGGALSAPQAAAAAAAAASPSQLQLMQIWAQVLGHANFSIDDDYFELGGDSLGLMQIGLALRCELQVPVAPERLFEATTVRAQALCVDAAQQGLASGAEPVADVSPAPLVVSGLPESEPVLASAEQEAFWQGARALRGWPLFNTSEVVGFGHALDVAALQCAVDQVVARHGCLRTRLQHRDGQLWQQVHAASAVTIEQQAVTAAGLQATVAQLVQQPFHVENGPLARWVLLADAEGVRWLVLIVHHAMTDAHSTERLLQDLFALYEAVLRQSAPLLPSPPPAPTLRYLDYALWQHRRMAGGEFDAARHQWARLLEGAPPALRLPSDKPRRAVARWQGGRERRVLSPALRSALKQVAAAHKATLYMVLLAALDVLLWQETGQTDLLVGSSSAGRPHADLHELAGSFIGALPMRVRLDTQGTWAQLLQQVRQVCLQAYALQDLPLGLAFETLAQRGGLGGGALLPVWLELHDRQQGWAQRFAHLGVQRLDIDRGISESEFSLEIDDSSDGLVCLAQYKSELFASVRVQGWLLRFQQLLELLAAGPEGPLPAPPLATTASNPRLEAC